MAPLTGSQGFPTALSQALVAARVRGSQAMKRRLQGRFDTTCEDISTRRACIRMATKEDWGRKKFHGIGAVLLHDNRTVWINMRGSLWRCNADSVRSATSEQHMGTEIARQLEAAGVRCWLDEQQMPGRAINVAMQRGIDFACSR